jgi:phage gpG-like protein
MPLAYNVRAFQAAPVSVEVNAKPAVEKLARLGAGMRNPAPVVRGLASAMRQHIRTAFAVGGFPQQWVPNRPNTIAAKGHSRVLHRTLGRGRSGLEAATTVTVSEVGREVGITMHTSALGRFHQEGRKGPWTIAPRNAPFLSFLVAGSGGQTGAAGRAAFRSSRARAQARRARTGRGSVPGRLGAVRVYALSVQHPGYPARPFLAPVDPATPQGDAFLQKHWRTPLRAYLFASAEGKK